MDTVICAVAGLSSRMGQYKPLLPLGESTIIRTLIERYRSCGIEQVILVTGHNAELLEKHVADLGVRCYRNDRYATSDMLESVKIGLRAYLEEGESPCEDDRILLTPGDIPLVRASTVARVLEAEAETCAPTMDGMRGHPLRLSRRAVEQILPYEGDGGLKGALVALGIDVEPIPVDDPGILVDADTPQDYERLQALFRELYEQK